MPDFQQQVTAPPDIDFPGKVIPTVFADGIFNLANSAHVVKFYMFRLDPSMTNQQVAQVIPCLQIVLPLDGFINAFAFLEAAVEKLRRQGVITEGVLNVARQAAKD
jgi:hypothetical protein